ncbi:MAG TPA: hypothetical protein VF823_07875 [Anaerolineales bacterium]
MKRWFLFIIAILVGVAAGLFYAGKVNPLKLVNATPDSLRIDYKTDYVLMVAESFRATHDLGLAQERLALLGSLPPGDQVQQAIQFAERNGYMSADLDQMKALSQALLAGGSGPGTPAP